MGFILIALLIVFGGLLVLKITTFGWFGFAKVGKLQPKDEELIERLKAHVIKISQEIGDRSIFKYEELTQTADYITKQFKDLGLEVELQEYYIPGKPVRNIIAQKVGTKRPKEVLIVGAHYDTCFNPGANDNASGLAGLLELARFVASKEYAMTIKFIAFVNEEPPFFKTEKMGSFVYARKAKETDEDIRLAIILETIGYYSDKAFSQRYPILLGPFYPNRANFIAVIGNPSSSGWARQVVKAFKRSSPLPIRSLIATGLIPGVDFSDHWSFWKMGYCALMVTDTAFYRYPHYHQSSDTFEKLDYRCIALVVEGLEGVLSELAR